MQPGVRSSSSERVFTRYVRALRDAPDDAEALFDDLWGALGALLRRELARAGLSTSPPRFVGVLGSEQWDGESFQELAVDAYTYSFVTRLRALQAQLASKPNIDGLIVLNVRNFLFERQRKNDPIGYRVYEVLRDGVLEAIDRGCVRLLDGDRRVRNDTVLGLGRPADEPPLSDPDAVTELAQRWSNELLPELVTGRSAKARAALRHRIAELFEAAGGAGLSRLEFKTLVDELKTATRGAWRAVLHTPEETAFSDDEPEQIAPAHEDPRHRAEFASLAECVLRAARSCDPPLRAERLETLWEFLVSQAVDTRTSLSQRRLAELLGIPRDALPALYETLRGQIEACRSASSAERPLPDLQEEESQG